MRARGLDAQGQFPLGIQTPGAHSATEKFLGFFRGGFTIDWHAVVLGTVVILTMLLWPRKWSLRFPASLLGIILATALNAVLHWPVPVIGAIPQTLLLADRLQIGAIPWDNLAGLIAPILSITALGAVESLLCGAVASNMTGIRLQANQELIAQGVGNIIIPFFGGVPATAAIARTSVGIKSGGHTRLVSIIHALALLASMFLLAPIMSQIPLTALAGVLMVTAWRMNEWESIHTIFSRRFKTAMVTFGVTLAATITFDLTQAILIGVFLSGLVYLSQSASIDIEVQDVDPEKLRQRGVDAKGECRHVKVAYLTGPLFFAATGNFIEAFASVDKTHVLILSMRAVPLIDTSGLEAMTALRKRLNAAGGVLMLAAVNDKVRTMLDRGGLTELIGAENIFWSADQAIVAAEALSCPYCQMEGQGAPVQGLAAASAG